MRTSHTILSLGGLFLTLAFFWSCGGPTEGPSAPAQPPETETVPAKRYEATGTVKALDPQKETITLDHEEIPGLMGAMTMNFRVADPALLEGVSVGNRVRFVLERQPDGLLVAELVPLRQP